MTLTNPGYPDEITVAATIWTQHVHSVLTVISTNPQVECAGLCYFDQASTCHFYVAYDSDTCLLGRYVDMTPAPTPAPVSLSINTTISIYTKACNSLKH